MYLCFAKQEGIIKGFLDGTFGPNENITYSAAAKIIVNTLFGTQEEGEGEDWWYPFSQILSNAHAVPVTVKGGDHLVTRGEMAHMISVLLQEQEEAEELESASEEENEDTTNDSKELEEFKQSGEPARQVVRPAGGPFGLTLKGPGTEVLDEYMSSWEKAQKAN